MNINNVSLVKKDVCTGCSACYNSCSFNAISMESDKEGFLYPLIDIKKCTSCGVCYKICPAKDEIDKDNEIIKVYAGQCKDKDLLMRSSSGGIFASIANYILESEGVVFGCCQDDKFNIKHISIKNKDELYKLQGSKYIQSDVGKTYYEAKQYLLDNKLVLYCGTPCQIDGLKCYLDKKYYNLITIDLVCHGITNNKLFKDYIDFYEIRNSIKITEYKFRHKDKKNLYYHGLMTFVKNNRIRKKRLLNNRDLYSYLYIYGYNHRLSCGKCKYASIYRNSDLTIGDYWGLETVHPELDGTKGFSVILVNTKYGENLISKADINIYNSSVDKAIKRNPNMIKSHGVNLERRFFFELYVNQGIEGVINYYYKKMRAKFFINSIKNIIPIRIRRAIKRIFKRG